MEPQNPVLLSVEVSGAVISLSDQDCIMPVLCFLLAFMSPVKTEAPTTDVVAICQFGDHPFPFWGIHIMLGSEGCREDRQCGL